MLSHKLPVMTKQSTSSKEKHLLSPERASLRQTGLSSCWLTQHLRATLTDNDCLGVGEDSCDGEATGALDVHEETARAGNEGLELMLLGLRGGRWVKKIDCENHFVLCVVPFPSKIYQCPIKEVSDCRIR